jgi:AcrR family transcriptional regulator
VRSALELFTSQGYHASTTPQIAEQARVAEGTIYRHFDSKEHLFNEIFRAALRVLVGSAREAAAATGCRGRLRYIAEAWQDLAGRDPALIKLVFLTRHGALLDAKSRDALTELHEELGAVIAAGKAAGEVRPGTVQLWTDVWLQLVVLALERITDGQWTAQHTGSEQVFDAAWDAIRSAGTATGA